MKTIVFVVPDRGTITVDCQLNTVNFIKQYILRFICIVQIFILGYSYVSHQCLLLDYLRILAEYLHIIFSLFYDKLLFQYE